MYFNKSAKIYVAGHRGLVGSSICRELKSQGYQNILTKTHQDLDLEDQKKTEEFILDIKPDVVFLAAAKVGGILANHTYPADFLMSNLAIQSNLIKASYKANVERLIFLGSSCIYPKNCPQPIKEEYLLTSELELTNRPYALAKIAGIEMCWSYNRQFNTHYLAVMPTNLYGLNDNYNLETSHVLPALIRKFHEAHKSKNSFVEIWGSGNPKREFLLSDDLGKALVYIMNLSSEVFNSITKKPYGPILNVGSGSEVSIKELSLLIKEVVGFNGNIKFNTSMPDGTHRKLLDSHRLLDIGWKPIFELKEGVKITYDAFKKIQN